MRIYASAGNRRVAQHALCQKFLEEEIAAPLGAHLGFYVTLMAAAVYDATPNRSVPQIDGLDSDADSKATNCIHITLPGKAVAMEIGSI